MKNVEYTVGELKKFVEQSSSLYDLIRVVDPTECKVIHLTDDGIEYDKDCFEVWCSGKRCENCSSYKACISGHRREKEELHEDYLYHIQSNPIVLELDHVGEIPLVIECITKTPATEKEIASMDERKLEDLEDYARDHDVLTGLLNWDGYSRQSRKLLEEHPEEEWLIIAADIKQFNIINELFGFQKGNEILLEITGIIKDNVNSEMIKSARLMSDQFALFMPKSLFNQKTLDDMVLDLQKTLRESIYDVMINVGIYQVTTKNLPFSAMYDRAVMALMEAREKNLNTAVWFDQILQDRLLYREGVIRSFHHTIGDHEYEIFLQPAVDKEGHLVGAEALARWVHPDGRIVAPDKFIPILEDAGMIAQLDQEIWEQAVEQLAIWKDTKYEDLYLSVNLAPHDFAYIDVYKTLCGLMDRYAVDYSKLRLEITEEAIIGDFEDQSNHIKKLREAGFFVTVDDFGKGYSSLGIISTTPLDALKVDMSFLLRAECSKRGRVVLESVIKMGIGLDMDVIVEGVETQKQFEMLKKMGCKTYQGFYFEQPLRIREFEKKYGE
jgi:diguanylate cyclase (GGDEF)-like protein